VIVNGHTSIQPYSLRPIILFTNIDVSKYILIIDISVLAKSNMGQREYKEWLIYTVFCG
jgi:hypothetical protein